MSTTTQYRHLEHRGEKTYIVGTRNTIQQMLDDLTPEARREWMLAKLKQGQAESNGWMSVSTDTHTHRI